MKSDVNRPIRVDHADAITTITLDDQTNRNALSVAMMAALSEALEDIAADKSTRAVIIRAEGPGFCSGHDLKEIESHRDDSDGGEAFYTALYDQCAQLMAQIRNLPQPVIASVQGIAAAAGCQLVCTADLAVASRIARFGVNGINSGFFCSTPGVALARNIHRKAAMELLVTGRLINADEAAELGLFNSIAEPEDLDAAVNALATRIAEKPGPVIALGKRVFYNQIGKPIDDAYKVASRAMVDNLAMEDCKEGIGAFLKKRTPHWNKD